MTLTGSSIAENATEWWKPLGYNEKENKENHHGYLVEFRVNHEKHHHAYGYPPTKDDINMTNRCKDCKGRYDNVTRI